MDVAHAHGHVYEDEEAHRPGLHSGEEEEHHEKKSVLRKVKDKAKKIKDTIGKKRHGHGDDHGGHGSRSSEEEEEGEEGYDDVEDDDGEQEPEVHGAPMYESEAARGIVSGQEGDLGKEMLAAGKLEEDAGAPKRRAGEAVPGSYQTGVVGFASPGTGGPEPGVIRSFQAMSVSDQTGTAATGSHDQSSPESGPAHGEAAPGTTTAHAVSGEAGPERRETQEQHPHGAEKSYTEKISSAIVEKAAQAKDAAVSAAVGSAEYSKKIADTVYEKVAAAGLASAVAPPLQQKQEEEIKKDQLAAGSSSAGASPEYSGGTDKPGKWASVREYLAEKLSPGEDDRALCEVISEAMQKRKEDERDVLEEEVEEKKTGASSAPGETKAEKGILVGKIKGVVTSLFGGSHGRPGEARGEAMDSSRVERGGGPRLQESTG